SEALATGVAQGVALTADELKEMIGSYYRARGLAENGFVPVKKLQELEITSPVSGLESRVSGQLETHNSKLETAK
ncbi:MAG TPA: hypothetical protein VGK65_23115, partial [Candidatus Binatia bacterium]